MLRASSVRIAVLYAAGMLILTAGAANAQSSVQARKQPSLLAGKSGSSASSTGSIPQQLDVRALEILKSVRDRLAAARTVSFVAVDTWEGRPGQDAPRIHKRRFEVTLKEPDKLRVLLFDDAGLVSQVNCNGRTMLTYMPAAKAVSIANAPTAITDCLKHAYQTSAINFPLVNLILAAPSVDVASRLQRAHYAGQSTFAGATTDVISLSRDNVVAQMWVATADQLPKTIRVTSVDEPGGSRHTLTLSDWQINMAVSPDVFTAVKGVTPEQREASLPHPVGTSGIQSIPAERPLSIHTYSPKYWDSGGNVPVIPYAAPGFYQSPDGYGYYTPQGYAFPPGNADYYGQPCYDCGEEWPAGAPGPGFNISLSTSGWYQPQPPVEDHLPTDPFWPGQIVSRLPVGCAAPYPGPAFYLCGDTWFAGMIDADGNRRFRVIGVTGY